jgi:threonyl-tRNA synthetase
VIPIREEHADYVRKVAKLLQAEGLRADAMDHPAHMNTKIKEAEKDKVPFLLIAGDREVEDGTVTVRTRGVEAQETLTTAAFLERALELRRTRALELQRA